MSTAKPFTKILFTNSQQLLGDSGNTNTATTNQTTPQLFPPEDSIFFELNRKFFPQSILFYFDIKLNIEDKTFPVASFLQPPLETNFEIKFTDENNDAEELLDYLTQLAFKKNTPLILESCFLHFSIERTSDRTQALEYFTEPFDINLIKLNPEKAEHEAEKSQVLMQSLQKSTQKSQLILPPEQITNKNEEYQKPPNPTNMLQLFDMVVKMSDAIDSLQKSVKEIKQEMTIMKQEIMNRRGDDDL